MTAASTPPNPVQSLNLRGAPAPAMRLSRKVLIAVSCAGGIAVGGCVMFALQPTNHKAAQAKDAAPDTQNKPVADQFNALPKDYSQVPKLGPALNGDLGKAVLASAAGSPASVLSRPTAAMDASGNPAASTGLPTANAAPGSVPPASSRTDSSGVTKITAATSQLFTSKSAPETSSATATVPAVSPPPLTFTGLDTSQPATTKTNAERQTGFINQSADRVVVSPDRLQAPASAFLIQAGSVIPAALVTGIHSDLPGQVTAQVTQNVYDSLTGTLLLIPQGSRLIGQYDNAVAFGQSRVLLAWTRLILPDGRSIVLEKLSAADTQGLAGLSDRTDYHWSGMLQAAALSTLLSVGAQAGSSDKDSDIVRALRDGAADSINRTGQQVVERQLNIQPTLTIRPGFPLRVILSRDLILEPVGR